MSVYKKLQEARILLQNTSLKKSGKNRFANYEYFELGDFLPTIQNIFSKVGLCGTVSFGAELATLTIVDVDNVDASNTTNYINFTSPMSTAELKGCHAIQNLGAVQTYLRRYLWVTAMEIVEHDALDATTGKDEPKKAEPTVTSPKIVGLRGDWQIVAPADPVGGDVQAWLKLVRDGSHFMLAMANTPNDVMTIFKKNKLLFDTVKLTDPEFFKEMMDKFTEIKTKLEKETQDGSKS
jgi:hypothetical protein